MPRRDDRERRGGSVNWLGMALVGLTTAAVGFLAGMMMRETAEDAGAVRKPKSKSADLNPETCQAATHDDLCCAVCLHNRVDCILAPCNHVVCQQCALRLTECPTCRQNIESKERIFF